MNEWLCDLNHNFHKLIKLYLSYSRYNMYNWKDKLGSVIAQCSQQADLLPSEHLSSKQYVCTMVSTQRKGKVFVHIISTRHTQALFKISVRFWSVFRVAPSCLTLILSSQNVPEFLLHPLSERTQVLRNHYTTYQILFDIHIALLFYYRCFATA